MRLLNIKLVMTAVSLLCFTNVIAQGLPNKQMVSVRAPANVKIDGKATEWGNSLAAYNKAIGIFYTMANDDKKLYLVVQCKDQQIMRTIINGGITLIVQKTGKKSDREAAMIKFPYLEKGQYVSVALYQASEDGPQQDPDGRIADSTIEMNNKRLASVVKYIYTKGLPGIDNLVSIYNDFGIQAANTFNIEKIYTSELAVDLRLLNLPIDKAAKFSYHIVANGEPNKYSISATTHVMVGVNSDGTAMSQTQLDGIKNAVGAISSATTDFWGEYTLATNNKFNDP